MSFPRSRRAFVGQSLAGLAGLGAEADTPPAPSVSAARAWNVICVGAHPDDPETGCGGTLAAYAELGHRATIIYLTRGERGIAGKSLEEAAAIRTAEAEQACRILGVRPVFAGQIDGATELSGPRATQFAALLEAEKPDVVFAQWPLDTHPDHQVAAQLVLRACARWCDCTLQCRVLVLARSRAWDGLCVRDGRSAIRDCAHLGTL